MAAAAPRPEGVSAKASPCQAYGSGRGAGHGAITAVVAPQRCWRAGGRSLAAHLVGPCCLFPSRVFTYNVDEDVADKPIEF